ncbi:MAG: hypothetical protein IPJ13_01965 [Saprospiraceae bacterium]|nr:hypothetical protein [Saprospiraceae bacterium]
MPGVIFETGMFIVDTPSTGKVKISTPKELYMLTGKILIFLYQPDIFISIRSDAGLGCTLNLNFYQQDPE